MSNTYKKFTAHVDTPTRLDHFAPSYIENIAERFQPIKALQSEYDSKAQSYAQTFDKYEGYQATSTLLRASAAQMQISFADFQERMRYFSLVMFGAVSAGKTSFICDLLDMTPQELTAKFADQAGFKPDEDEVSIGASVATINLYENLIEKSAVRLVDVPGISGVAHDNDTLAPFVDMADCVLFFLNAYGDISKDDEIFIYERIAALGRKSGQTEQGSAKFTAEKGLEKKIVIVVNKWHSNFEGEPPAALEKEWNKKVDWLLYGKSDKPTNFKGIAPYFDKPPVVVPANTSRRYETGERKPGEESKIHLDEVIEALRVILEDEGASLRLNRPRQILIKEIGRVKEELENQKARAVMNAFGNELAAAGVKVQGSVYSIIDKMEPRLANLANAIANDLSPQLKKAIWEWKPKVGIVEPLKGIVPEWFPGAKKIGLGKTAFQADISRRWTEEIRTLINQQLKLDNVKSMITREMQTLATLIDNSFHIEITSLDPKILGRLRGKQTKIEGSSTVGADEITEALQKEIDRTVAKVRNEIVDDLVTLLITDIITDALLHALLTPVGGLMVALIRRWVVGNQRQESYRQQIEAGVDNAVPLVATEIQSRIAGQVRKSITETASLIQAILGEEQKSLTEPQEKLQAGNR